MSKAHSHAQNVEMLNWSIGRLSILARGKFTIYATNDLKNLSIVLTSHNCVQIIIHYI